MTCPVVPWNEVTLEATGVSHVKDNSEQAGEFSANIFAAGALSATLRFPVGPRSPMLHSGTGPRTAAFSAHFSQ